MSNYSSSTASLGNIIKPRNNTLGFNLSSKQAVTVPANLRIEIIIIPSTSAPNWGSSFIFDVKEKNCIISDLVLNFNVSAITGRSGDAINFPHFSPATFWTSKVKLVVNNVTTRYSICSL